MWTARTRFHYADMLLRRADAGDEERARELARIVRADAHELGMPALVEALAAEPFASVG